MGSYGSQSTPLSSAYHSTAPGFMTPYVFPYETEFAMGVGLLIVGLLIVKRVIRKRQQSE